MTPPITEHRGTSLRVGLLCLGITSVGWGLNWPVMKVVLRELPPLFARGMAGLSASLGFVVAALMLQQSLKLTRSLLPRLALASFVNVFAWMGFSTMAMRWLNVGQGALLVYTMPIWATLVAWPLAGKRPSARATFGLLLCMAGLWVLFGQRALQFDHGQLIGAGLALAAAVLFALGTVALAPITQMQPFAMLAWQLGLGCLPMVVLGLVFEHPEVKQVTRTRWALMLYMTLIPMGLCYLTWFAALRRLPPATASVATLLTPVIGVMAAAYALGEPLGIQELAALLFILSGVGLTLWRKT